MAKFCTKCGKEIAEGIAFCTECGAKLEANETTPASAPPPEMQPPPTQVKYQRSNNSLITPGPVNKVVGTGAYFGLMLLFALPVIGFIACIIMAFVPKNKNIKNFARATLIWMIIAFILLAVLIVIASILAHTLTDYINQMTDGQFGWFGDFFGQFNEIKDSVNDLNGITEQFVNGGFSGLPLE